MGMKTSFPQNSPVEPLDDASSKHHLRTQHGNPELKPPTSAQKTHQTKKE